MQIADTQSPKPLKLLGFWRLFVTIVRNMFGCKCFYWNSIPDSFPSLPKAFSLPCSLPQWPQGQGFATGRMPFGELEVLNINKFECVWNYRPEKTGGATFYKPVDVPDGFFCLGHYGQSNDEPLRGYVLVARDVGHNCQSASHVPALTKPVSYRLIWSTDDVRGETHNDSCYFWLPVPPKGYKAVGFVVSNDPETPSLEEVRCVRDDLTESCETYSMILKSPFYVWSTRPCARGMFGKGASVGTFFCSSHTSSGDDELKIACLKNLDHSLQAMPNLDQIHALIKHYGPTVSFHPEEKYLPCSVPWFFKSGALLYKRGDVVGEAIDYNGSNLPNGGKNDGEYWIDLPGDDGSKWVKNGDIESAELYVHVKPALGGTFTDIVMWIFCPFNGPATLKLGFMNISLDKIGQHVGDWEHITLRVSNFSGELWSIYFSQHSGGEWVNAYDLDYTEGNKAIVYSTKYGHASFPHSGSFFQGSNVVGIRNDAAWSNNLVDSSVKYQIVAAEYLGEGKIAEPCWLQFMREWGPNIEYNSKLELDKIIKALPFFIRFSFENWFDKLPVELYGEEGPTGPKEKDNWFGDERC